MPQVACPRCGASQSAGATGYTCSQCGAVWAFATCDHCGARFHMRPGTTAWTCPDCGTEHGATTMGQLAPDEDEVPTTPPSAAAPTEPGGSVGATPARSATPPVRTSGGGPPSRARLAVIAAVGIVTVLALAFGLSALGGGSDENAAGESSAGGPSASGDPVALLCQHFRDIQTPREDAYTRLADNLQSDAAAIQAQGDAALARKVLKLRVAVLAYRDALTNQGDLTEVSVALGNATKGIPCAGGG